MRNKNKNKKTKYKKWVSEWEAKKATAYSENTWKNGL